MDLKALMDGSDGQWTEERHSLFLNGIEASFVRRMLSVDLAGGGLPAPCLCSAMNGGLKLNRYIPDSATESTEDSRRRSPAAAVIDSERRCTLSSKNTRKRHLARRNASQDQVVPESDNGEDGDGASVKRKHASNF